MSGASNQVLPGDHAPWFQAPVLSGLPRYAFNTIAGRHILMLFFGTAGLEPAAKALQLVGKNRAIFDDDNACFLGVTVDPGDEAQGRIAQQLPGIRFVLDYERQVSTLFGAASGDQYRPQWMLIGPDLRVVEKFGLNDGEGAIAALRAALAASPEEVWAPVLRVPDVFEPQFCRELIRLYQVNGGRDSGFMRDVDGKTIGIIDHSFNMIGHTAKSTTWGTGLVREPHDATSVRRAAVVVIGKCNGVVPEVSSAATSTSRMRSSGGAWRCGSTAGWSQR